MKKKAINVLIGIMFVACFCSPILLAVVLPGKAIYVSNSSVGWVVTPLVLFSILISSVLHDSVHRDNIFSLLIGIITFCIGAFLSIVSLWYLLISIMAIVYIFLILEVVEQQ